MIIAVILILFLVYIGLIGWFYFGIDSLTAYTTDPNSISKLNFSVIIPFRNEEKNLPDLLKSISQLKYPASKFEILFINDASEDTSEEIIHKALSKSNIQYSILQNIQSSNSPKKDAISLAIKHSKFEWIITTDADCIVPELWITSFDSFLSKQDALMVAAPVMYRKPTDFLETFQTVDFLSLQGVTLGSFGIKKPFLCNGANLCYKKKTFFKVNGFTNNNHIASGDDVFLLDAFRVSFSEKVQYLKNKSAIVYTKPTHSFKSLIQQRVRWASKTSATKNFFSKFVGLIILSINFAVIGLLFASFIKPAYWLILLSIFVIKLFVDFIFIYKTASFFNNSYLLKKYLIHGFIYPFFLLLTILLSLQKNYTWKGRNYKK